MQITKLQCIKDDARLLVGEVGKQIPFEIRRFYIIDNCVPGLLRGHHAHKKTVQFITCLKGSFELVMDDGKHREEVVLTDDGEGVLIPARMWHEMREIGSDTIIQVLADAVYDESDYIRNYDDFLAYVK